MQLLDIDGQAEEKWFPKEGKGVHTWYQADLSAAKAILEECLHNLAPLPSPDIITRLVLTYTQAEAQTTDENDFDTMIMIETATLPSAEISYEASTDSTERQPLSLRKLATRVRFNSKTEDIPKEFAKVIKSTRWGARFPESLQQATSQSLESLSRLLQGDEVANNMSVSLIWKGECTKVSYHGARNSRDRSVR